jgi:hypothetical protein
MRSKGLQGELGRTLGTDQEFRRFFDDLKELLATG